MYAAGGNEADAHVGVGRGQGLDHLHAAAGLGRKELDDPAAEPQGLLDLAGRANARRKRQPGPGRMLDHGRIESWGDGEACPGRLGGTDILLAEHRAGADQQRRADDGPSGR